MHAPNLPTLDLPPSWHNRAGRTDRSACLELRASHIHPSLSPQDWQKTPASPPPPSSSHLPPSSSSSSPPPPSPSAPRLHPSAFSAFPLARARFTLHPQLLQHLHQRQPPRPLAGDYRSAKANAMNPRPEPPAKNRSRIPAQSLPGPDHNLPANPNRGAAASKTLALPPDWSQSLTLERWQLHPRLAQHFLLCPHCNAKYLKLFLPLCTPAERRDAQLAALFLRSNAHHPQIKNPTSPITRQLHARYAPLWPENRRFLCRHCLHLRYGQHRPKSK